MTRYRIAGTAFAIVLAGCSLFQPTSRVREGDLYRSGVATYDFFFSQVHDLQQLVPKWSDDARAAKKALVDELNVQDTTPESTLAQLAHEKVESKASSIGVTKLEVTGDDAKVTTARSGADTETAHFLQALESMTKSELAFAKRMRGMGPKVEALARTGHDLEARVPEDFGKYSEMKANEVKGELAAAFEVLDKISASATRTARDAEFLIADLQRAVAATGIGFRAGHRRRLVCALGLGLGLGAERSKAATGRRGHASPRRSSSGRHGGSPSSRSCAPERRGRGIQSVEPESVSCTVL